MLQTKPVVVDVTLSLLPSEQRRMLQTKKSVVVDVTPDLYPSDITRKV